MERDLVDELRLLVFTVVLGTDGRLFGETTDKKPMRLVDARPVGNGLAVLIYQPVRKASGGPLTLGACQPIRSMPGRAGGR